jgi:enoyl-CoA hydratase/carnithine racemase
MPVPLVQADAVAPGVRRLRLCRPEKRNALSLQMVRDALDAIAKLEDEDVHVAILGSEGPVFCGGADLTEDLGIAPGAPSPADLLDAILASCIFWIAAVQGPALGIGASLVAVCPLSVVRRDAWFSLPEMRFGVYPSGAIAYLERRLGRQFCLEWALLDRRYPADAPEMRPMVSALAEADAVDDRAAGIARSLQATPAAARAARLAFQGNYRSVGFLHRRNEMARLLNEQLSHGTSNDAKE